MDVCSLVLSGDTSLIEEMNTCGQPGYPLTIFPVPSRQVEEVMCSGLVTHVDCTPSLDST